MVEKLDQFYGAHIVVSHNFEAAHRLYLTPGKCERIHGHSFWVDLTIHGDIRVDNGMLEGLDFGHVKKDFRQFLDTELDHALLMHQKDPWSSVLFHVEGVDKPLPGVKPLPFDPTTENLAMYIAKHMGDMLQLPVNAFVRETEVNAAAVTYSPIFYGVQYHG